MDRLEGIVLALVEKVKKMANGLDDLQNSITELGQGLKSALSDLVSAHDSGDDGRFEELTEDLDGLVSQLQSLGKADNQATKAGQSPTPAVDLRQNAGPTEEQSSAPGEERDVVVKGREMPD
jgi:hypothetical protein